MRRWLFLSVIAFGLAACIADDPVDDAAMEPEPEASQEAPATATGAADDMADDGADDDPVIDAEFVDGPCPFNPPPGSDPRCGTVTVPEDWAAGTGEVTLTVAVYPSTAETPTADPVVYLDGGPGSHALDAAPLLAASLLDPLLTRSDVVIFDQRGAGQSEPQLACGEVTALTRELEDTPGLDNDEVEARFGNALRQCRDRLTGAGIDLSAYTTINNAHDVEAIRVALGYGEWNLLGISYGTRLGLEVMRQHPDGVRSAVLDSVFPPQVDSALENPGTFLDSYEAVVAACAQEPECAAAGDLGVRLADVANRYEAEPVTIGVTNLLTGESDDVLVDGDAIVGVVTQALYSTQAFGDLPELVAELEAGETAAITSYLSLQRTNETLFTDGMFYAIVCNEEIPFADPAEVDAALPDDPFGLQESFDYGSNTGSNAFTTCAAYGPEGLSPPPAIANEAVTSDIPALVMAGRYDPVTPVAWSELAAETLTNSYLVVDPYNSHGVSPGECGMEIVGAFLDDPSTQPDASCFNDGSVAFLAPVDSTVTLEPTVVTTDSGRELVTVRPAEWVEGGFGDSYRQASFLDPTQIIQFADNATLKLGLEFYLDQQFGVTLGPLGDAEPIGGRAWQIRSGSAGNVTVEWWETEIDGLGVVVLVVSTVDEFDSNVDTVLRPALEAIDLK